MSLEWSCHNASLVAELHTWLDFGVFIDKTNGIYVCILTSNFLSTMPDNLFFLIIIVKSYPCKLVMNIFKHPNGIVLVARFLLESF